MSKNPGELAVIVEVQQERRELESLLESVRAMFHEHRLARADGAARLLDALDELREHLGMMFALKETDGYLDEVVTASPPLSEHVGELKAEHTVLFEELSCMIEQCDRDVARGRWGGSCKFAEMTFENFCERLHAHEAGEAELVQQAFNQDTGVGD
jgi:hypothetical protein